VPLGQIAPVDLESSINSINHENTQRRIVVSANLQGLDLGSTVEEKQAAVREDLELPQGYHIEWAGQFESQQSATKLITLQRIYPIQAYFWCSTAILNHGTTPCRSC